jgi:hypothetical protein
LSQGGSSTACKLHCCHSKACVVFEYGGHGDPSVCWIEVWQGRRQRTQELSQGGSSTACKLHCCHSKACVV